MPFNAPATQTNTRALRTAAPMSTAAVRACSAPTPVTLGEGNIEETWRMLQPLILWVEREDDGWYIVSDDLFGIYGDGPTFREAQRQYISSLIDHHEFLIRESQRGCPDASLALSELERMQRYLQPAPTNLGPHASSSC